MGGEASAIRSSTNCTNWSALTRLLRCHPNSQCRSFGSEFQLHKLGLHNAVLSLSPSLSCLTKQAIYLLQLHILSSLTTAEVITRRLIPSVLNFSLFHVVSGFSIMFESLVKAAPRIPFSAMRSRGKAQRNYEFASSQGNLYECPHRVFLFWNIRVAFVFGKGNVSMTFPYNCVIIVFLNK